MVDVIFQQQVQLRQQRQAIEESRRRLMSQQSLRQAQDRNVQLQRQQQLQKLGETEQQISSQDIQLQQLQEQQVQQSQNREAQRQQALKILVEKGKGSSALYSLPKEERAAIEAYASELKASRERGAGIGAVGQAERTLNVSLTPQLRRDIFLRGASGQASIELPNLSSKFQQLTQPQFTPAPSNILQSRPLFVSPAKTFTQQAKDIIFAPVPTTRSGGTNIPAQVRKISPLVSLTYRTGISKVEQKLKEFGIGKDSPIFATQVSVPVKRSALLADVTFEKVNVPSGSKLLGDLALGSLLVGLGGSAGQVAVSRYVKNGRVYYLDNTGQVIGSEAVEQASKNIIEFRQALRESKIFKKAGDISPNEGLLRERTRELISKANDQQLKSLRELYKKEGRLDLYNDLLAQERDIAVKTNIATRKNLQAVKDRPAQLTGAGQITSQFAGTGQYERTEQVVGGIPRGAGKTTNNLGLTQTAFQFEQLSIRQQPRSMIISSPLSRTKQSTQQINQLGLKSETQTKQGSGQARALLTLFRTAQQTKQQTRQLSQLRSQLDFGRPRGRPRPPRPRVPTGFKLPDDNILTIKKVGTEDSFGVGIEVRRKGKFQVLGTEASLERALRKGAGIVDIGLARSFRLRSTETGQLLDVSQLPIGFRRSKREARTFVEESSRALSQFGEKKEIKYFKNLKGRRRLL